MYFFSSKFERIFSDFRQLAVLHQTAVVFVVLLYSRWLAFRHGPVSWVARQRCCLRVWHLKMYARNENIFEVIHIATTIVCIYEKKNRCTNFTNSSKTMCDHFVDAVHSKAKKSIPQFRKPTHAKIRSNIYIDVFLLLVFLTVTPERKTLWNK